MLAFAYTKGWMEGLTDSNATIEKKKKKANSNLTMYLTGKAFKFSNRSKNCKDIWETLEEEYAPREANNRDELEEEFKRWTTMIHMITQQIGSTI